MKLQRLAKMQPAELAFRLRQQMHTTMDRMVASGTGSAPRLKLDHKRLVKTSKSEGRQRSSEPARRLSPTELQELLQRRMPDRFFSGITETAGTGNTTETILRLKNKQTQRLIAGADAVRHGEFDVLGYGRLSFGQPVNWHLDPVSGQVSPSVHWSQINPLNASQVGDCKVVWELNRHQWLLELGQAFRLTGDEQYALSFAEYIEDWMIANPPGWGINWASALEVSLRLISWCWALCLFSEARALTPSLFKTMLAWIQRHAQFVEQNLSRYFSPNTHLTIEALGLFYVGILLPELEGAERWKNISQQVLIEQLPLQVYADGVYFEQSTRYQHYTAETYLHFVILAERNGLPIPDTVRSRLKKLLEFLLQIRHPDGSVPQIGDTDGGCLLPLVKRSPGDYSGLFSTAAVVFESSQFAWAAGGLTEETLILHGSLAAQAGCFQKPEEPQLTALQCFQKGGYVVMRNGWGKQAHQLILDTGPLGCHVSAGHGHADLLSIQCCAFGETFLTDSGTGCYSVDPKWRNYFRSSRAHSTMLVDGLEQAQAEGSFSWLTRPSAQLLQCDERPDCLLAEAQHDAYIGLADPVTHRRRVRMSGAGYWVVVDDLLGGAMHELELRYQFAPLAVSLKEGGWVWAQGACSSLWIKVFCKAPIEHRIEHGELEPIGGWHSPNYGQRIPAPALVYNTRGQLPMRLVTVIYPVQNLTSQPPDIETSLYGDLSSQPIET